MVPEAPLEKLEGMHLIEMPSMAGLVHLHTALPSLFLCLLFAPFSPSTWSLVLLQLFVVRLLYSACAN